MKRIEKLRYMQVIGWEFRAVLEQAKIERPLEGFGIVISFHALEKEGKNIRDRSREDRLAQGQEIADCSSRCQDIHVIWICGIK